MVKNSRTLDVSDILDSPEKYVVNRFGDKAIYFRNLNEKIGLDTPIFRYMKLEYFLSMMNKKELYVPNRRSFTDLRDKIGYEKFIPKDSVKFKFMPVASTRSDKAFQKEIADVKARAMNICISCWAFDRYGYEGVSENFLMWKSYSNGSELICRIGTTIGKLINSIKTISYDIVISDVSYSPRKDHWGDRLIFNKSPYYMLEQELRMAVLCGDSEVILNIDPYNLIDEIWLSPFVIPQVEGYLLTSLRNTYSKLKISPSNVVEFKI